MPKNNFEIERPRKVRVWDTKTKQMILDPHFEFVQGITSINDYFKYYESIGYIFMDSVGPLGKNGKRVFEGDIFPVDCDRYRGILIDDKRPPFVVEIPRIYKILEFLGNDFKIEVVGNVFENPELLQNA